MAKKVLLITGSPRPEGNTNTLASAFAAGAMAAGNEVQILDAASCNLDGCHGDGSCFERGYCGLKDDGVKLHELMCWADVLVLCSPVYWKGFSSQIKRVIDRFHPYCAPKGRAACTVKETYLIAAALMPGMDAFTAMQDEFAHINAVLDFKPCGELLVPGVDGPGEIQGKPEYIEQAVQMGYRI